MARLDPKFDSSATSQLHRADGVIAAFDPGKSFSSSGCYPASPLGGAPVETTVRAMLGYQQPARRRHFRPAPLDRATSRDKD
jgi:hypothetical protein